MPVRSIVTGLAFVASFSAAMAAETQYQPVSVALLSKALEAENIAQQLNARVQELEKTLGAAQKEVEDLKAAAAAKTDGLNK